MTSWRDVMSSFNLGRCQVEIIAEGGQRVLIGGAVVNMSVQQHMLEVDSIFREGRMLRPTANQTVTLEFSIMDNSIEIEYPEKRIVPQKIKEEPPKRLIRRRSTAINCKLIDNPGEKL